MSNLMFLPILLHCFLHCLLIRSVTHSSSLQKCFLSTYYVPGIVVGTRDTEVKEIDKPPLPSRSWHCSGSLVIIIVYPNRLYIFPSLVEFVWLLLITAIEWSLFMIFCPTSFLKGSGIPSSKGACTGASLTVSRHLFSLEIGWLKGPVIKVRTIRRL